MLFFHSNAEDLKLCYDLADLFRTVLHINVLAVEYPGYGLYNSKKSARLMLEDAECVYDFAVSNLKFVNRRVFVFGRSIGTGPATHLARYRKVGCLLLMSGYTSIKDIVRGKAWGVASIIKERFNNIENIRHVTCPTFLVHGKKDTLIPYTHSQMLQEACRGPCSLYIPSEMDHDTLDYCDDLVLPISAFLLQSRIIINHSVCTETMVQLTPDMLRPNPKQKLRKSGGKMYRLLKKFS